MSLVSCRAASIKALHKLQLLPIMLHCEAQLCNTSTLLRLASQADRGWLKSLNAFVLLAYLTELQCFLNFCAAECSLVLQALQKAWDWLAEQQYCNILRR